MLSHHRSEHLDPHHEQPLKESTEHRRSMEMAEVVPVELLECAPGKKWQIGLDHWFFVTPVVRLLHQSWRSNVERVVS